MDSTDKVFHDPIAYSLKAEVEQLCNKFCVKAANRYNLPMNRYTNIEDYNLYTETGEAFVALHQEILDRDIVLQKNMLEVIERSIHPPMLVYTDRPMQLQPGGLNWVNPRPLAKRPKVLRFLQLIVKIMKGNRNGR